MIRLSEARARSELRDLVTKQDAEDVVSIMKFSLWDTYSDDCGNIDFQRSQHGTGMSKKGEPKRFIAHLSLKAQSLGSDKFSYDQVRSFYSECKLYFLIFFFKLSKIAQDMGLKVDNFRDFVDTLNNQGYLLKKGNRLYSLATM